MGLVIDISPRVSVETRRESAALVVDDAHVNADDGCARIEFHYDKVIDLHAAIQTIIASDRFQEWLRKKAR